jgi:diketogulonate reductase-like aldo/keto reductase
MTPRFIYGTAWKEDETSRLVALALRAGFRAIDTANQRKHYHEAGVGQALAEAFAEGVVRREDVFLQTKFTYLSGQDDRLPYDPAAPVAEQVRQSFESSLKHLGVDRIDSYVLHGPSRRFGLGPADLEAWGAMEEIHASGRAGALGISNAEPGQLEALCAKASVKPSWVQNRCFAADGWDREMRAACRSHGITYQGFSLLTANLDVLRDPVLLGIARKHERTPAQVVFRFAAAVGMVPLTGTTDPTHMSQDLAALDFALDPPEVSILEHLGEVAP